MNVWLGQPYPLGSTWDGRGVNFALFSENAAAVELCLFDGPTGGREIARIRLPEQTDQVWHVYLPGIRPGQLYGYRVYGPRAEHRLRFLKRAQSLGLTLAEIKLLIESPRGRRDVEASTLRGAVASKITETRASIARLRSVVSKLERLEAVLVQHAPPDCCHLGDCACWLPEPNE